MFGCQRGLQAVFWNITSGQHFVDSMKGSAQEPSCEVSWVFSWDQILSVIRITCPALEMRVCLTGINHDLFLLSLKATSLMFFVFRFFLPLKSS